MAEQDDGIVSSEAGANGADTAPSVGVISQYLKDFSFENPSSPQSYQWQGQPRFDVQFNIGATRLSDEVHEVVLKMDVRSESDEGVLFVVDLSYAGLFGLRNVPEESLQGFLLGEAPRLLFPFARRVLADAVRDGGFPPLMLDPIDFNGLYLQQAADAGALAGEPAGNA